MCLSSVLMQSAQMSLSGKLMSSKLDAFQLNFCALPTASAPASAPPHALRRICSASLRSVRLHVRLAF